jgi:hypothetical protein
MHLSIAICTWNRAESLDRTLAAMQNLQIPAGISWELLVVNNNCTDHTNEVVNRYLKHLPIRPLSQPRQGVSHAHNCAIAAAQGQYMICTDDDILVDPDWIAEYVKAFRAFPDAAFFGGTIDTRFAVEPPRCFNGLGSYRIALYGSLQLGPAIRLLAPGELPFGGNMAFRLDVLQKEKFSGQFGPKAGEMILAGETEMLQRLVAQGKFGVWVGTARVTHCIPREHITAEYIRKRLRCLGQTSVRMGSIGPADFPSLTWWWAVPQYWISHCLACCLSPLKNAMWMRMLCCAAVRHGILEESWRNAASRVSDEDR